MKQIYKYFTMLCLTMVTALSIQAQTTASGVKISDIEIKQMGERLMIGMVMDFSNMHIRSNRSVRLTPTITNGNEMMQLPAMIIDGRRRSIIHSRHASELYTSANTYIRRKNKSEQYSEYDADVAFEGWMQGSELVIREECIGCHDYPLSEELIALAQLPSASTSQSYGYVTPSQQAQYTASNNTTATTPNNNSTAPQAQMAYIMPTSQPSKQEMISIYFPVNSCQIGATFMDNSQYIAQLGTTLSQPNLEAICIMGYASPEGPYTFNQGLAARRAEAVKKHIENNRLASTINISTNSSPGDWDEVKQLLSEQKIDNWQQIIAIIEDSSIAAADKNNTIKQKYPTQYAEMLRSWYPKLRKSSITITSKAQSTAEVAKQKIDSNASDLTLEDIYLVALTHKRGSRKWDELIIIAVEKFPDSAEARINAANVAMANGDYTAASKLLQGVPETIPEAMNSRGILAMAEGNYTQAMNLFEQAQSNGVNEATYNISLLQQLINNQ